jgi:hypothetical protein
MCLNQELRTNKVPVSKNGMHSIAFVENELLRNKKGTKETNINIIPPISSYFQATRRKTKSKILGIRWMTNPKSI